MTLILGIFALVGLLALWLILGATYEFLKCYYKDDDQEDADDDDSEDNSVSYNNVINENITYNANNRSHIVNVNVDRDGQMEKSKGKECLIITALVFLGLLVQPIFLMFKFIEILLECYRRYGCWFYYLGSY